MGTTFDAVVIGGGIAGLSVAAELARDRRVIVLEQEPAYASQATARSAASWMAGYGRPSVTPFALASRAWFESGGGGHAAGLGGRGGGRAELGRPEGSLLHRRGLLLVTTSAAATALHEATAAGGDVLQPREARALFPALRATAIRAAVHEPETFDIDVMGAVEACRSTLRSRGGTTRTTARVTAISRVGFTWRLVTTTGSLEADLIVDAAGAWADEVAELAGLPPLGLRAFRRTVCTFPAPSDVQASSWPMLMHEPEHLYIKPESGGFLASPADETPQPAGEARPRMDDVALALDRVREMTTLEPHHVHAAWAGLRTFAPDRSPVLGPDPAAPGFAWFAGLGGVGIMIAPAAARSVVSLVDAGRLPEDVSAAGGERRDVLPDRLRA